MGIINSLFLALGIAVFSVDHFFFPQASEIIIVDIDGH